MTRELLEPGLSIGQVAKAAQVHVETVRFYERKGLICQPTKPYRGIRRYPHEIVQRIRFLKHAQSLGFTLNEAREMLVLQTNNPSSCVEVRHRVEQKLVAVREKCAALHSLERALQDMIKTCNRQSPAHQICPILRAMDGNLAGDKNDNGLDAPNAGLYFQTVREKNRVAGFLQKAKQKAKQMP